MDFHAAMQACNSAAGRVLMTLYLVDKAIETVLGEMAKSGRAPAGSVIGLLAVYSYRLWEQFKNLWREKP
jgi:hypothetical protein